MEKERGNVYTYSGLHTRVLLSWENIQSSSILKQLFCPPPQMAMRTWVDVSVKLATAVSEWVINY